jgi:hypothetical protein
VGVGVVVGVFVGVGVSEGVFVGVEVGEDGRGVELGEGASVSFEGACVAGGEVFSLVGAFRVAATMVAIRSRSSRVG